MISLKYVDKIRISEFYLSGWKTYFIIEYGFYKISEKTYLVWRVQDTKKEFTIDLLTVNTHHGANYQEHFEKTLTVFREDLIKWYNEGLPEEWMKQYWIEFGKFIII